MPTEHFSILKQVDGNWCIWERGLIDRNGEVVPGHRNCSHDACMFEMPASGINAAVARQDNGHLVAQRCQFFRQAPNDIGYATLLGKRNCLSSNHQNLE